MTTLLPNGAARVAVYVLLGLCLATSSGCGGDPDANTDTSRVELEELTEKLARAGEKADAYEQKIERLIAENAALSEDRAALSEETQRLKSRGSHGNWFGRLSWLSVGGLSVGGLIGLLLRRRRQSIKLLCPKCGYINPENAYHCIKCGTPIKGSQSAQDGK